MANIKLVEIADTPEEFIYAAEKILVDVERSQSGSRRVDAFLANVSWDKTWNADVGSDRRGGRQKESALTQLQYRSVEYNIEPALRRTHKTHEQGG